MLFYWPKLLAPFLSSTVFNITTFFLGVGIVGLGLRTDIVQISLSKPCIDDLFLIVIVINNTEKNTNQLFRYYFSIPELAIMRAETYGCIEN